MSDEEEDNIYFECTRPSIAPCHFAELHRIDGQSDTTSLLLGKRICTYKDECKYAVQRSKDE